MLRFITIGLFLLLLQGKIFSQNFDIQIFSKDSSIIEFPYLQIKGSLKGYLGNESGKISVPVKSFQYPLTINIGAFGHTISSLIIPTASQFPTTFFLQPNSKTLDEVIVQASPGVRGPELLNEIEGTTLIAGKKAERIEIAKMDINLGNQNLREVFSKNPGMNIIESDPSNLNTSIAIRGLSTNRSWDFNNRINGHDFTPDPLGYNEAYFTPNAEITEKIDIIRGAASLQFGPQVGGLINYVLEKPQFNQKLHGEFSQTIGSFGLASSFGKIRTGNKNWAVIASNQYRTGDGFRENSSFHSNQSYLFAKRKLSDRSQLSFELTYAKAIVQQPGGLTKAQFDESIFQSNRSRNFFSYEWFMPTLTYQYSVSDKIHLEWQVYYVKSNRIYLGFNQPNAISDTQDPILGFAKRSFSQDDYGTKSSELKLVGKGLLLGKKINWVSGMKVLQADIIKNQGAEGTNSRIYEEIITKKATANLDFTNKNLALFLESNWHLNEKLQWTVGLRNEHILFSALKDQLTDNPEDNFIFPEKSRSIFLYGTGLNYQINEGLSISSNFNRSFKPITNSQLAPSNTNLIVDPNLEDAFAQIFDLGIKGKWSNFLRYDINYFYMQFNNQVGTITQSNGALFQTNLGTSLTNGLEAYIEYDPVTAWWGRSKYGYISFFGSLGLTNAKYQDFLLPNGKNLGGNQLEYSPKTIFRSGFTYSFQKFRFTYLLNYVSSNFSDAANTVESNATATVGEIPAYLVQDISLTYKMNQRWVLRGSASNLANQKYFNKRNNGGTNGEGILPASPRNFSLGLSYKFGRK